MLLLLRECQEHRHISLLIQQNTRENTNMRLELLRIGTISIKSYGLMIAVGIIAAIVVGMKRAKRYELEEEKVLNLGIVCVVCGLLGAKILYIILDFKSIIESPSILEDIAYGFVVYGGLIGGLIGVYIYCRYKKISFLKYMDLVAPSVAIGQGFGRIGCFLAGCCYGRETTSALGVIFPASSFAPTGVKVLPTQLFSSAGDFIIAIILIIAARHNKKDGTIASLYFILYGIGRYAIEFLRNDYRGNVGTLSTSQFISIFWAALGIGMLVIVSKKKVS